MQTFRFGFIHSGYQLRLLIIKAGTKVTCSAVQALQAEQIIDCSVYRLNHCFAAY